MSLLINNKPTNSHLIRERSLWKDDKGRTLMVLTRWWSGPPTQPQCTDVDLLVVDALNIVRRPWKQLATWVDGGQLVYAGECSNDDK